MGKTASVNPPSLQARATDVDGDQLQFDFHYWSPQTGGSGDVYSTVAAGQLAGSKIPQTFVNSLATGNTVGWNVRAYDGHAYGPWSKSCYYQVDKTDPDEPSVTSSYYPQLNSGVTPVAAGTPGIFDIETPLGTATSMTFVYHLDGVPSAASPSSTEKVAATKLAVGTGYVWDATVTLAAPSPGPHDLHVYSKDQAGNSSGLLDYQFLANGDTHVSCSTLSSCFNNVITSPPANPAGGDGDGAGNSIASQDLAAAGWSGTNVTIDGATFTLPSYGSGLKDNLLAKGQTVSLGGVKGSAVVVLATGTDANTVSPPVDTTSVPATLAAPFMPQGTAMVGYRDATQNAVVFPSGTVNYAATGTSPASYSIGVPDWSKGPAAPAVLTLPHTDTPSGVAAAPLHLYAFAIPVNPKIALASISLPDIAGAVTENGQNTSTPTLHILGIAVRPAATADLPAGAASGSAWDAAWSSPPQGTYSPAAGSWAAQQTLRTALTPAVSGTGIRIRLSNAGGTAPLTIAAATIAVQSTAGSAAAAGAPTALTFGAKSSVTIPAGAEAWSDPLAMTVSAGQGLLVSESIGAKITALPGHTWNSSATTTWLTPADGVDHAADASATAFTASGSISGHWTNVLTDVAVSTANPVPAVAVIGDDLVNPSGTGMKAPAGGTHLADQLIPTQGAASVVDESIANNQLLNDATTTGGPALLSRVDRDVLDQPGIGTVIVNEGLNDLFAGTTAEDADPGTAVAGADGALQQLFGNFGITLIYTTPTPCGGYTPCTASVDAMRQNVAVYLDNHIFGFLADTSGAVGNSATAPPSLQTAYDAGDHANLSGAGYLQLSGSILSFWYTANQFS